MGGVWPTLIEELKVTPQPRPHIGDGLVGAEVDLLVLDRAPEPFDKDVVAPAALAIHADPDVVRAQDIEERGARELRALIRVEDLGRAEPVDRLLECGDAEVAGQRRGAAPRQHFPRGPVHDGTEKDEAASHWDIRDIGRPDLVRPIRTAVSLNSVAVLADRSWS